MLCGAASQAVSFYKNSPYAPPGLPFGILDGNVYEVDFRLFQMKMAFPIFFKPRRGVRLIEMNVLSVFRAPEGRKVQ